MAAADGFVDQTAMGLAEPQPMYRALRESAPVFRSPEAVVLSRLADIEMALKHTELFSSNMDAVNLGNVRPLIPLQIDPPEHAKSRRVLDPLFTPREMARREPRVCELVNEMIDAFADRGECDFHAEFAVPLPCTVFLQLLGLPLEDPDTFLLWKDGSSGRRVCATTSSTARPRRRGRSRSTTTSSAPSTTTSPSRATTCCPR